MSTTARLEEPKTTSWQQDFLAMLPKIRRDAEIAFRALTPEAKDEAIQEVICNALVAYRRLVELNKTDLAYPSALARFGIAQCRAGRKVGSKLNVHDVSSRYCQRSKGIKVERLDTPHENGEGWQEAVVEDKTAGPAEVAITKIDFTAWLKSLSPKMQRVAKFLATGEATKTAARHFGISPGRVSQVRRELRDAWLSFQGEPATA